MTYLQYGARERIHAQQSTIGQSNICCAALTTNEPIDFVSGTTIDWTTNSHSACQYLAQPPFPSITA